MFIIKLSIVPFSKSSFLNTILLTFLNFSCENDIIILFSELIHICIFLPDDLFFDKRLTFFVISSSLSDLVFFTAVGSCDEVREGDEGIFRSSEIYPSPLANILNTNITKPAVKQRIADEEQMKCDTNY